MLLTNELVQAIHADAVASRANSNRENHRKTGIGLTASRQPVLNMARRNQVVWDATEACLELFLETSDEEYTTRPGDKVEPLLSPGTVKQLLGIATVPQWMLATGDAAAAAEPAVDTMRNEHRAVVALHALLQRQP